VKLVRDYDRLTAELRSAHPGRKEAHWLLSMLATHPKHEGRGAGSMLIKWAFPRADDIGVKCYGKLSFMNIFYPLSSVPRALRHFWRALARKTCLKFKKGY